jgi:hypothetical protein
MKTRNALAIFSVAIIFCSTNISCKKLFDKEKNCRLTTITHTHAQGTRVESITYNNEDKISTMVITDGSVVTNKVFLYSGNTILITSTITWATGSNILVDSVTLDNQGRAVNIRQFGTDRLTYVNTRFEYSGEDLLRASQTTESSATPDVSIATYVNGNMVRLEGANGVVTLEYYTNEQFQQGDYLHALTFTTYGVGVYPHKNLLKTMNDGSNIFNFSYEKNDDGLIEKVNVTSAAATSSVTYQYECD